MQLSNFASKGASNIGSTPLKIKKFCKSWNNVTYQRAFLDNIAQELKIQNPQDWYKVKLKDICNRGGFTLLARHDHSLYKTLCSVYPEQSWKPWLFTQVSRGFWKDITNQKQFLEWFSEQHGIKKQEDWYKVTPKGIFTHALPAHVRVDIQDRGGATLLNLYGGSLYRMLIALLSEFKWKAWQFPQVPKGFWSVLPNQRHYFDVIGEQLGISTLEDWYTVRVSDVQRVANAGLLDHHGNSLIKALRHAYPHFTWQPWKFRHVHKGFWDNDTNTTQFLESLSKHLSMKTLDDWQDVTHKYFKSAKGSTLINKHRGIFPILARQYPGHTWDQGFIRRTVSKMQILLQKEVQVLFRDRIVMLDFRHPDLMYAKTQKTMVLDLYLPELELAFEYNGGQHYRWHFLYGSHHDQQTRDKEKRERCLQYGITLIDIPHWWDEKITSLASTIHFHRPDVIPVTTVGRSIPLTPPHQYVSEGSISVSGEFSLVAEKWVAQ